MKLFTGIIKCFIQIESSILLVKLFKPNIVDWLPKIQVFKSQSKHHTMDYIVLDTSCVWYDTA